ncbi:MAG: SpoIID/LytB domain-containing protein [Ignavibacteria bacterium]|nr:SpoIID/LytB domain-containing protein [Ignavibacteria bacterium]
MFDISLRKVKIKFILYLILLTVSTIFLSCSGSKRYGETQFPKSIKKTKTNNLINVLLQENLSTFTYLVKQEISISNGYKQLAIVKSGNQISFKINDGAIIASIGRSYMESEVFVLSELSKSPVLFNDKKYRGEIILLSNRDRLQIVNSVDLEDYLKGVLPVEMGVKGKQEYFESLKAFAIAARTFALMKMSKSNNFFDIYPDVRDQVYGGYNVETQLDNCAVEETKGEYLSYSNEYATILYHSTCGGVTEDVGNVFSATNIPYLISQKDGDDNCKISPSFNWTETYSNQKIIEFLLNARLINDNSLSVSSININERFPSGRIKKILINLSDDTLVEIGYRQIRSLFRRNDNNGILRSTNFIISTELTEDRIVSFTLTGKGNGHGVGLCQWGSMALSSKGWNYRKILEFYFPATSIRKINA